jgi:transmembrane sensor
VAENINKKVDEMLGGWKTPFQNKEASWQAISQKIDSKSSMQGRVFALPRFARVAAALAIILGLSWVFIPRSDLVLAQSSVGKTTELFLPDGSKVTLNAVSEITYSKEDFEKDRVLDLSGEAFFQVKEGSRFTVRTEGGEVSVLGTEFNVHSRENRFMVQCRSGRVAVTRGVSKALLTKGMMVQNASDELTEAIEDAPPITWMEGQFLFSERPVMEVFSEIERQFGVRINGQGDLQGLFTGEFERSNLISALDVVCSTMGLNYQVNELQGEVLVSTK